ncbi:sodium-coupled neutral amino acid transporter 7-like [Physella acuta]|uniref:sodium-coupled neutral amino acid transporter 7-like n=1 Tax=Physella acuta TaxID=109671 RepID=UPI0027DC1A01|nr:sodium-coupled neutral amino acid transporter 7-like [Physella acuta]
MNEQKPFKIIRTAKESTDLKKGSGWFLSTFLLVNATLGAGLLNIPMAYHQAGGVVTALIAQTILLVPVIFSIFILAYCADIKGSNTYPDMVLSICGPTAQMVCAACLMVDGFVMCVIFLIVISDQWEVFFLNVAHDLYCQTQPFYMSRTFVISFTSAVFILPLCFSKQIDFLRHSSVIGVIGSLCVAVLVVIKYFLPHDNQGTIATTPHSWIDVLIFVPVISFAFECHVGIVPIYSCMAKRNMGEFSKTVTLALILCIITYTATAILGYLQFGDNITHDILLSFNPTTDVMVAVVLVAVKTYTAYPILCFVGKAAFETLWRIFWKMSPEEIVKREKTRRVIITLVWFTLTLLLAVLIPNMGVVVEILGALAVVLIFVFPGLCLFKTMQNKIESGEKHLTKAYVCRGIGIVYIIVGTFIFGLTVTQAIIKDIQGVKADTSKFSCSS